MLVTYILTADLGDKLRVWSPKGDKDPQRPEVKHRPGHKTPGNKVSGFEKPLEAFGGGVWGGASQRSNTSRFVILGIRGAAVP